MCPQGRHGIHNVAPDSGRRRCMTAKGRNAAGPVPGTGGVLHTAHDASNAIGARAESAICSFRVWRPDSVGWCLPGCRLRRWFSLCRGCSTGWRRAATCPAAPHSRHDDGTDAITRPGRATSALFQQHPALTRQHRLDELIKHAALPPVRQPYARPRRPGTSVIGLVLPSLYDVGIRDAAQSANPKDTAPRAPSRVRGRSGGGPPMLATR